MIVLTNKAVNKVDLAVSLSDQGRRAARSSCRAGTCSSGVLAQLLWKFSRLR